MATNNTTFWELIESHKINIPIIQRDYAQGREEESEKREKFLNAILKHLMNNEKLHLDFVYGRVKDNIFYPIDGQQRLTTLFLLHWYFALKEKIEYGVKSKLSQFVYDTRISSREFCQCLIKEIIDIPAKPGNNIFIAEIKNKPWYRNKWDADPTVKAMLVMIQAIHDKFYGINSSKVFSQLTTDKHISFELLDLGAKGFELTDELYIKMNARGKQLTRFENFKANLIQLIDKNFKNNQLNHPIKGQISYSGYFSYKIEKEWTDMFWAFRGDKKTTDEGFSNYFEFLAQMLFFKCYSLDYSGDIDQIKHDEKSLLSKILNPIRFSIKSLTDLKEKQLLVAKAAIAFICKKTNNNYFADAINKAEQNNDDINGSKILELRANVIDPTNITDYTKAEILAYLNPQFIIKKSKEAKADDFKNSFAQYEEIFCSEENLLFLFNSLDKLFEILNTNGQVDIKNVNNLFNAITDKSHFFWNATNENSLFERIILNTKVEDARNKIMLFAILHFMVKHNLPAIDDALEKYIRVIRNLLQATRQKNETKYNTNIRINNFGSYWLLFDQLSVNDIYQKIQEPSINNSGSQISEASLRNECEKAKLLQSNNQNINSALMRLEEFEEFGGLIHQLKPLENHLKYQDYLKAIEEIWADSISDTLRIQALIACGFEGLKIKDTKMGKTCYFGRKRNWSLILTNEDAIISKCILFLLDSYISSTLKDAKDKLQEINDSWLKNNKADRSFKYYFLKYPEFTSKLNYYVWPRDYEISILGTEGTNPLIAYHISPFVMTVCKRINDKSVCDEDQCYLQYSGYSPLMLKNGVTMTSKEEGWLIPDHTTINDSIILKYDLILQNNNYVLKDTDRKDRIEIAIDFINDIFKK